MLEGGEDALAEIFKILCVGLADLAEEETVETGDPLTIVGPHLGEEPVGFAAAARTAVADSSGAIRLIAQSGGGTGGELARLEEDAGADQVIHLVRQAPGLKTVVGILIGIKHKVSHWLRVES